MYDQEDIIAINSRHYTEWVEKTSEMSPESMTKTMIIHIVEKLETKPEFQLDTDRYISAYFATTTLGVTEPN